MWNPWAVPFDVQGDPVGIGQTSGLVRLVTLSVDLGRTDELAVQHLPHGQSIRLAHERTVDVEGDEFECGVCRGDDDLLAVKEPTTLPLRPKPIRSGSTRD